MKKVEIRYNSYTQKALLRVDGEDYIDNSSRLSEFVTGNPMERWLSYYAVSYKHWDGILPELMEELNDDEIELVFCGTDSDYRVFSEGIIQTFEDVRVRGFEPEHCRIMWKAWCMPENMSILLHQFANRQLKMLTAQLHILKMETLCRKMDGTEPMDVADIRDVMKAMEELFREAACGGTEKIRNYWDGVLRQFHYLCEEGK